jgi:hypothetical protein
VLQFRGECPDSPESDLISFIGHPVSTSCNDRAVLLTIDVVRFKVFDNQVDLRIILDLKCNYPNWNYR